jgi:hypothetical protein
MQWVLFGLTLALFAAGAYIKHLRSKTLSLTNDLDLANLLHKEREEYVSELEDFAISTEYETRSAEDEEAVGMSASDVAAMLRKRFSDSN